MNRAGKAPQAIFHAHNWSINRVINELSWLAASGFDAIQLSPLQASPSGTEWYLRYQPYDFTKIEGLGSAADLVRLCKAARVLGVRVIADLVFNHMAIPTGANRDAWIAAQASATSGDQTQLEVLLANLDRFPGLTRNDFQPWRDMQGDDWDNENRYEAWGNGEWSELKPTENVIRLHNIHIKDLYEAGVRGFRFDAVKHMRVDHLKHYVRTIHSLSEPCWMYGEVFSTNPAMHAEYRQLFPTTDFPYVRLLKTELQKGGPIDFDADSLFLDSESVRFGMNHDLALNPPHLMEGLLFSSADQTLLANILPLIIGSGTSLIFEADIKHSIVIEAVQYRNLHSRLLGPLTIQRSTSGWTIDHIKGRISIDLANNRIVA